MFWPPTPAWTVFIPWAWTTTDIFWPAASTQLINGPFLHFFYVSWISREIAVAKSKHSESLYLETIYIFANKRQTAFIFFNWQYTFVIHKISIIIFQASLRILITSSSYKIFGKNAGVKTQLWCRGCVTAKEVRWNRGDQKRWQKPFGQFCKKVQL